jgi:c-di-GMP-binding flagellar brake protein YcgR
MADLHPQGERTGTAQPERRRYPRTQTAVQIEFLPEGAAAPTHTHTTDLSLGGCYVEMNFTLQIGSKLDLVLWLGDEKVTTRAIVVTHHPYFGNGMQFVNMAPEDQAKLKRFLESAS